MFMGILYVFDIYACHGEIYVFSGLIKLMELVDYALLC